MGYSSRYHAASLTAVFIALAIGILVGIGLADDVVSPASEELEASLRADLDEARADGDDLRGLLDREREFGSEIYPSTVADQLVGSSVALIRVGEVSDATIEDIEEALAPAGASIDATATLAVPPDLESLADEAGPRFPGVASGGEPLVDLGTVAGAGIAGGNPLLKRVRSTLFSRFNGELEGIDRVVLVGDLPEDLEPADRENAEALLGGLLEGIQRTSLGAIAAERTSTDPTTLTPYMAAGISTADHVDLVAGRIALVRALLGDHGNYGVKEGADRFLPELIQPATLP